MDKVVQMARNIVYGFNQNSKNEWERLKQVKTPQDAYNFVNKAIPQDQMMGIALGATGGIGAVKNAEVVAKASQLINARNTALKYIEQFKPTDPRYQTAVKNYKQIIKLTQELSK